MEIFLNRNTVIGDGEIGYANTKVKVSDSVGVTLIGTGKAVKYNAKAHDSIIKKAAIAAKRVDKS